MRDRQGEQWSEERTRADQEPAEAERRPPRPRARCPGCHMELEQSLVAMGEAPLKSCPRCSQLQGLHVFYPLDAFREHALEGWAILDPWCESCIRRVEAMPAVRICPVPLVEE
jgi:hypothetical protein